MSKKRFKTENEFALYTIPLILGGIIPTEYKAIAEVPRSSHSDHADLLVIKPKYKIMRFVEFKLSDKKKLNAQIKRTERNTGIKTIGIINREHENNKTLYGDQIIGLNTFSDQEVDWLCTIFSSNYYWTSIYDSAYAMMYWYASLSMDTEFNNAGAKNADCETLYIYFRRAVKNLNYMLKGNIHIDIVMGMFRGIYALSSAQKHMTAALKK